VQDHGHSLRVKNALTSEVKPILSPNGYGEVILGVGSYDLMYHLDSFDISINPRG
jgi:hypothetical protein